MGLALPSQTVLLDILNIGSPYKFSFEDSTLWLNQQLFYGEVMLIQKAVMVHINLMVGITSTLERQAEGCCEFLETVS